jgi:hypothetical protein
MQPTTPAGRQRQLAAVKHGLFIKAPSGLKLKARRVRLLAQKVWATLPWLQPSDEPAVRGWCELEVVTSRLFADVLNKAEPGTTDLYRRVKTLQLAYERELGMTPTSRAALGLSDRDLRALDAVARAVADAEAERTAAIRKFDLKWSDLGTTVH